MSSLAPNACSVAHDMGYYIAQYSHWVSGPWAQNFRYVFLSVARWMVLYGQSNGGHLHTLGLKFCLGEDDLLETRHIDNLNRVGVEFRFLLVD